MKKTKLLLTVAKLLGVAAVAAFIFKYEQNNDDEATENGRIGKTLAMWSLGFAVAAVGGFAALSTLPGLAAVLATVVGVLTVFGLVLGAGADAKRRLDDRFGDRIVVWTTRYTSGDDLDDTTETEATDDEVAKAAADGGDPA